jgi:hypothetical protein
MKLATKVFIFISFVIAFAYKAEAQSDCASRLMPAFTTAQANRICDRVGLANDTWLTINNAAKSALINVLKIDSSDNTVINSSASDILRLQLEDDAQRIINFSAASDTAILATFGDGGTTAVQSLLITASTADADDDGVLELAGGGGASNSRGGYIDIYGNENAQAGDVNVVAGSASGSRILLEAGATNGTVVATTNGTTALTIESDQDLLITGDLYLADGQNLGFTAASSANAACDTTCTTGCVAGWDTGTSVFVACSNAIADTCLCTK